MQIEHITWEDAECESSEWADPAKALEYAKSPLPIIESVGYVLHETPKAVTLIHSIDKTDGSVTHTIKIPKKMILKRKKL